MKRHGQFLQRFILPLVSCVLAVLGCLLLYRYDNKYTRAGPQALHGVLLLSEADLRAHPFVHLIDGWEYFGDQLLTPADFAGENPPIPDQYVFIGQYGGFEAGDRTHSPYGSATYRLFIQAPEASRVWMLELPEIFSAYRLYINSVEVASLGVPEAASYRPQTGNRTVVFEAGGHIELLIAVSDYSHIYSGMVYPPAFGRPDAVTQLLNTRLVFCAVLCAMAAAVGLLALCIGLLGRRNALPVLYGALCICFVGYTGYPLWKTLAAGFYPGYAVENFCFCAMLVIVICIHRQIAQGEGTARRLHRLFACFGLLLLLCVLALIVHLALPAGRLWMLRGYSGLLTVYEWSTAAYLTISAVLAVRKGNIRHTAILCGIFVFDCALMMDRLLPMHEPVYTGWFIELASAALLLLIGVETAREMARQYRKSAVLEERTHSAEQLLQMQYTYRDKLLEQVRERSPPVTICATTCWRSRAWRRTAAITSWSGMQPATPVRLFQKCKVPFARTRLSMCFCSIMPSWQSKTAFILPCRLTLTKRLALRTLICAACSPICWKTQWRHAARYGMANDTFVFPLVRETPL